MVQPPLNPHVRIVDEQGRPTPEFIRWWQSNRDAAGNATLDTALKVSAALDKIGGAQGAILYRDSSNWNVLAPGVAGRVLKTGGPGANPSWAVAGGGTFLSLTDTPANYTGAAGQVVAVNAGETGLEFVAGGSGGISPLGAPPSFASFTVVNSQAKHALADSSTGGLGMTLNAGANVGLNVTMWGVTITDGDFDFKVHMDTTMENVASPQHMICVRDSASGRFANIGHLYDGRLIAQRFVNPTTFGANLRLATMATRPQFLRIARSGATVTFYYSASGGVWVPFTTLTIGANLPATTFVGLAIDSSGSTVEASSWIRGWDLT